MGTTLGRKLRRGSKARRKSLIAYRMSRSFPVITFRCIIWNEIKAEVAELADAHGSGPCTRKGVGVRVPSSAPEFSGICYNPRIIGSDSAWCRGTPKPARGHTATHRSGCRRSHLHRVGAKIL